MSIAAAVIRILKDSELSNDGEFVKVRVQSSVVQGNKIFQDSIVVIRRHSLFLLLSWDSLRRGK